MSNLQLLAAAFSQVLNCKVILKGDPDEDKVREKISPQLIFELTYDALRYKLGREPELKPTPVVSKSSKKPTFVPAGASPEETIVVIIKSLHDATENAFMIRLDSTVFDLKWAFSEREGIAPDNMQLTFLIKVLEDDKLLVDYGITDCSTVYFTQHLRGGAEQTVLLLDESLLDPQYDWDFTDVQDSKAYERGGYPYKRPYGWKRIALKVKGKYKDDIWLGELGPRTHSSPGEWAVSYHGTSQLGVQGIAESGYNSKKLKRELYGKGHYSTPDIEVAKGYAGNFESEGKEYRLVLQNRVNLAKTTIVPREDTGVGAEYFVTPLNDDIRAYALCIQER